MTNKIKKYLQFNITKQGNTYKISKRLKHNTKAIRNILIKKLNIRRIGLVELLMNVKLYKQTFLLKLIFVLIPLIILIPLDNVVMAMIMTIFDIFCCALIFSLASTERKDAMVNGAFDYGKYKYIKSYRETIAILVMFFISSVSIIIGHYFLKDLLPVIVDIVVD